MVEDDPDRYNSFDGSSQLQRAPLDCIFDKWGLFEYDDLVRVDLLWPLFGW